MKCNKIPGIINDNVVTPFAGVWIEIEKRKAEVDFLRRHSLRGSVD